MTREEIELRIRQSEAETATKFARLEGRFDLFTSELRTLASKVTDSTSELRQGLGELRRDLSEAKAESHGDNRNLLYVVLGSWVTLLIGIPALIIAVLALMGDEFGRGADVGSVIEQKMDQAAQRAADRTFEAIRPYLPKSPPP